MPSITDYITVPPPQTLSFWKCLTQPWRQFRFQFTGGPSVGKTSIIDLLGKKTCLAIEEPATRYMIKWKKRGINEPWLQPNFSEKIVRRHLKNQQLALKSRARVVCFDRSPIDTLAYDIRDGKTPSKEVIHAVQSILNNQFYEKTVFFIKNLGFFQEAENRHESFKELLEIEAHLEKCYRDLGFNVIVIPRGTKEHRVGLVWNHIQHLRKSWWSSLCDNVSQAFHNCFR